MVLKIASLVLLCGCLVAAKESDSQQKRQTYLGSPQANRYLSGDAYQLHQSRLTASLAQNEEQDSAAQAQIDEELRREAINNAKSAAELFKQSYRQSRVQPQQYPYATQEPAQQVQHYQLQQQQVQQQQVQQQQGQQQQVQQQHVAYAPTQAAPQEQNYQPVLQSVYQNTPAVQRLPANSQASLQSYQAHAQLAEEAAKAFQEALQQRSSRQKRPRLQNSQYILEQQHSFTVPEQTPEQYNLAAVQQAYQQIEEQQRQAAENIRSHETRPAAAPTAPTVQQAQQYEEPSLGYNIGDGPSDYEPARQRGQKKYQQQQPAQQELTVEIKPRRPSAVRSRPVVSQTYQAENPTVYPTEPATVAPAQYETANQVPYEIVQQYQPQTTQEPAVIPTYQPAPVVPSAPVAPAPARQPIRAPAAPTKPVFLPTPTPPVTRVAAPARVAAPVRAPVAAPQPVAATPTRVAAPVQVPQAYAAQAVAAPVRIPAAPVQIPAAPVQIPAAPAQYSGGPAGIPPTENIDGKLVNLDLNLLRSLYQAAETLAKKQKDDIGPISEDELIKALIEQGKREQQQAAEQLKKAQAEAEQRPKVEVVRIPKTKQITQEELQALIAAGYDITPIDEEPTAKNADPIKQQYLRQAEFLERQAQYRSQKPNTRRARDNRAQDEVAEE